MGWSVLPFILACGLAFAGPVAAQRIGAVEEVRSTAFGTPPAGTRAMIALRRGVVQDERIETASDAAVGMRFVDDTIFRVGPDSTVLLDAYVYDSRSGQGTVSLALLRGGFRYVSGRMAKTGVQLVTPSVTIGVRGTDFAVIVHPGGMTDVFVFEGSVDMRPSALATGTLLVVGQYGRAASSTSAVEIFGAPPSDRGGFIGIAEVDRRIEGSGPGPAQPGFPDRPFFNPIPATPQAPQPPMMPQQPPGSPTFPGR